MLERFTPRISPIIGSKEVYDENIWGLTLLRILENGNPLSRAKDQIMREAVARNPMVELKARAIIIDVMPVAPPVEFVACRKISM